MAIAVAPSKWEVVEIPFGKPETLRPPKPDQMRVNGETNRSTDPAFTPGVVRGGDELAKRQGLLPKIRFHNLKCKPAELATAIRCSTHAGLYESSPHKCLGWRSANWMDTNRGQLLSRQFLTVCASFCV
jgi:hypothetical protein